MLCNNLDPEVAEDPSRLVVYGGSGRAARSHEALRAIVAALLELEADETLLVQSGKPVAVFRTHPGAPRVLIANSLLVPRFATWDEFRRLEAEGLTMFGQMTAGSWIYIGTQGILQGTYQTFAAAGEAHWGSPDLAGRTILTAGLGGMGGAQPLAASLAGATSLNVEVDPHRIERRLETRYLDEVADDLDDAVARVQRARRRRPRRLGRPARERRRRLPGARRRGVHFDLVTDQTSAHDMLNGYVPRGDEPAPRRSSCASATRTSTCAGRARPPSATSRRCSTCRPPAATSSTTATTCAPRPRTPVSSNAFDFPGFVPAYVRPLFCRGAGPFRWAALSGDPADIARIDRALLEEFPDDVLLQRWLRLAPDRIAFQGLPARICWLGYGDRAKAGLLFNDLVRRGEVSAPIVIGRDHLDTGSVASPFRETESMKDGSDAIADWPILNALLSTSSGRVVGVGAPRRRRRHRQLDPRRPGDRRRRHRRRWTSGSRGCSRTTPASASPGMPTRATRRRSTPPTRAACGCRWSEYGHERPDGDPHRRDRRLGPGRARPRSPSAAGTSPRPPRRAPAEPAATACSPSRPT